MERYFEAKAELFTPPLTVRGVVNGDTAGGRELARRGLVPTLTFGLGEEADVRAADVEVSASGCAFTVDDLKIRSPLRGTFNDYNCLGALAAARQVGIDDAAIAEGLASMTEIPGRLEAVEGGQ